MQANFIVYLPQQLLKNCSGLGGNPSDFRWRALGRSAVQQHGCNAPPSLLDAARDDVMRARDCDAVT
jgi:hypothetical protein